MSTAALMGLMVAAVIGVTPAVADATTWCVKDPTCPPGGNSSQTTIMGAVGAAATTGDTILIGPGKFMETVQSNKTIDFTGSGSTQTVIQSPTPGTTTFSAGSGGTIRDLGVELAVNGFSGLLSSGLVVRVAVTAPPGTTSGLGVQLVGGTFDDGSIVLPTGPGVTTVGAEPFVVPAGAVQDSTVTAAVGLEGIANIARDRIVATQAITESNSGPSGGLSFNFVVDDASIQTVPGASAEVGISTAVEPPSSGTAFVGVTVRHSTFVGSGGVGSTGVDLHGVANLNGGMDGIVRLDSSIIRGYATTISRVATGGGAHNSNMNVIDDYSDFAPAAETSTNNGVPVGSGGIFDGAHDVNVDPGFVSTTPGDPNALHLLDTSPLIDIGDPALGGGESPTDADGAPRIVAGRAGAKPVSDIGAFEFQPHPPTVTATGPAGAVKPGTPAGFTATASDPDPGDSLSLAWHFDDGGTATGTHVSHAFAKPGTHTATVTVTDLEGFTAMASAQATVVPPPAITKLTITPDNLLAATSGPAVKPARAAGAIVSYSDSQKATTKFTIERVTSGVRSGARCVKLHGKRGHRKHCSLLTTVSSFTHSDVAGANRLRFSGRVGGRRLPAATYQLTAVPSNAAGTGAAAVARFRVHH